MKLRKNIVLMMTVLMMATLPTLAKDKMTKIVYQCDFPDAKRVHLMLNTLNNVVKHYQSTLEDYEVNIVVLGPCLQYIMKDYKGTGFVKKPYIDHGGPTGKGTMGRLKSLVLTTGDNLKITACRNTMKKKNVKDEQIADFSEFTPSGIIKIVDLENEGYAYIKIM
jgi:intracellular sulfur oxidation DsrE/DsrF family protein